MSSYAAMGSAIWGALGTVQFTYRTNGTATTTGTLGVYDSLAPQRSAMPYLVYQLQSSLDEYVFGGQAGEAADYFVRVVSNDLDPTHQAFAIYDQMHEALQDKTLTVTGGYSLRCSRTNRQQYQDAGNFWHVGGVYRINTWDT